MTADRTNTCGVCGLRVTGVLVQRDHGDVFSPDNHRAPCGARCLGGGAPHSTGTHRRNRCGSYDCTGGVR